MGLSFGQLASGAGAVGAGMDRAQGRQQLLRQDQLAVEAQNREDAIRQQAAQRAQQSGGLKIPDVMQFAGGQGGQNYVGSLGIPVPTAPPAAPPVSGVVEVGPPVQPQSGAQMQPQSGSPIGRYLDQRKERVALLDQVNAKYRSNAGLTGLFANQTDAQRNDAKSIMGQYENLDNAQLKELLATGKLPAAAPTAGIKTPSAEIKSDSTVDTAGQNSQPRSIRNNNPGNITYLFGEFAKSVGATGADADGFAIFPDAQTGQQATIKLLQSYGNRGFNTVSKIINRWSPANGEGNTSASTNNYISYVANTLGVDPNTPLDMSSPQVLQALAAPMAKFESGHTSPLLGDKPKNTADMVAKATAAPATSGVMYGPASVSGGGNPAVQSALVLRQLLAEQANDYYKFGMTKQASESVAQVAAIDLGLYKAQADQGVAELTTTGDAGRAMAVLSQFTGTPHQALSRGDGTYDLYVNGKVSTTAVSVDALANLIKVSVDSGYREQVAQLGAKRSSEVFTSSLKMKEKMLEIEGDLQKAIYNGEVDIYIAKQRNKGTSIKPLGDGTYVVTGDGEPYMVNPNEAVTIAGVPQRGVARRIPRPQQ
jgi:hypothetical protein